MAPAIKVLRLATAYARILPLSFRSAKQKHSQTTFTKRGWQATRVQFFIDL